MSMLAPLSRMKSTRSVPASPRAGAGPAADSLGSHRQPISIRAVSRLLVYFRALAIKFVQTYRGKLGHLPPARWWRRWIDTVLSSVGKSARLSATAGHACR
jgi:hypothetical protein